MKKIPFVDLYSQYQSIKTEIDNAISTVIKNTAFIGGEHVKGFETNFAEKYGVKHCVSVANGTDAIYIIMKMLGIGAGDEVITTATSWISTSETISQTGAKPVFVDINDVDYTIDVTKIEDFITKNTKAIIPVHLYGQAANIDKLKEIVDKHNLYLIEDCAQSHFSKFNGQNVGTFGIASTFSFYPGKNLGAYGDAGAILTNDDELAEKCKMYANHGALKKHQHKIEGINSRLDGLQAAILNVKLNYINEWTAARIKNAKIYDELLADVKEVTIPKVSSNTVHSFHLYVIKIDDRDGLQSYLNSKGIETAIHYPTALPLLPAYSYLGGTESDFPKAFNHQKQILSIPMYPELTRESITYICDCIKAYFQTNKT